MLLLFRFLILFGFLSPESVGSNVVLAFIRRVVSSQGRTPIGRPRLVPMELKE